MICRRRATRPRAFTLVELLVVVSVISILMTLVTPVMGRARSAARAVKCSANLRQLGAAWQLYADENRGFCMPQVWFTVSPYLYWWGEYSDPPDFTKGMLYPFLVGQEDAVGAESQEGTVFSCPEQSWGTYVPQGAGRHPTTTYGYNGMYLCPPHSGWDWGATGANAPWKTVDEIESPGQVFVLADTLIDFGGYVKNNCLLDGPQIPMGGGNWSSNSYPTLCFRHGDKAAVFFADGHLETISKGQATLTSVSHSIGYVGEDNAPHYVLDWRKW